MMGLTMEKSDSEFGELLYQEPDIVFNIELGKIKEGINGILVAGIFTFIIGLIIIFLNSGLTAGYMITIIGFSIIGINIIVHYSLKKFSKFKIYEKGIKFRGAFKNVLRFQDINNLLVSKQDREGLRSFSIRRVGDVYYHYVFSEYNKNLPKKYLEDYELILTIIVEMLKKTKKDVPENILIRTAEEK